MTTTEAGAAAAAPQTQPDTAAIIAREIAGEPAPAAPPQEQAPQPLAERPGPTTFTRHRYSCSCDWCNKWCETVTPTTSGAYTLPVGTVINKDTKDVLWTVEEIAAQKERERQAAGAPSAGTRKPAETRKPVEKVLTPTEKALEAVKAGANEIDAAVLAPAAVKALLDAGRHVLIGALEAQAKAEHADKAKRAEALRAAARKRYEEECKRAEEADAPYLQQIAALETELKPLQERVEELTGEIADLRSMLTAVELPEELQEPKKKAASSPTGEGTRKERRPAGVTYEDQAWKHSATYQFWLQFNKRFPDMARKQAYLTPLARAHGIPLKDLSEVNDDNLDRVAALVMAETA